MADKNAPPPMTELEKIQAELLQLDLEEKRENALRRRSQRTERAARQIDVEQGLANARNEQAMRENACPHKKGGTDLEGLFVGNDNNHAVIKHIHAAGDLMVVCQRCGKKWEKPVRAEYETLDAYRAALLEYQVGVALPTDNSTSGSQLFSVERAA